MERGINPAQLELLQLLQHLNNEKDAAEIRSLLIAYLSDKVVRSADADFRERGYAASVFEAWKQEHFRKGA